MTKIISRICHSASAAQERWDRHPRWWQFTLLNLTLVLGVMSILLGYYVESFATDSWGLVKVPLVHLRDQVKDEVDLAEFSPLPPEEPRPFVYLFVLDCSSSVGEQLQGIPLWYESGLETLRSESYLPRGSQPHRAGRPSAYEVIKVGLFLLLRDLNATAGGSSQSASTFAIWNVCGEGIKHYPADGTEIVVNRLEIGKAIRAIESTPLLDNWKSTDFRNLFGDVTTTYGLGAEITTPDAAPRSHYVLTVISDFLDDPRKDSDALSERRWRQVEDSVKDMAAAEVDLNLVEVSNQVESEVRIVSLMRKNFDWFRFRRVGIEDLVEEKGGLLYPLIWVERPLRLYYDNQLQVDAGASFRVSRSSQMRFAILSRGQAEGEVFRLQLGFADSSAGDEDTEWSVLSASRGYRSPKLSAGSLIRLRYSGSLPARSDQYIQLSVESEGRTFLIPVHFVRRLPQNVAFCLVALYILLGLAIFGCGRITFLGLLNGWYSYHEESEFAGSANPATPVKLTQV